jgi:hypothetical protein
MVRTKLIIGKILSKYVSSVIDYAAGTGNSSPSDKIHPVQKVSNASLAMTKHFKLVRDQNEK